MKIFAAVTTLFAGTLASNIALAACDPSANNNVNATCAGTTVNQNGASGYGGAAFDNLNVTVSPGSSVTGTSNGIVFNSGSVQNSGTITGGTDFGVSAAGNLVLNNTGTISGGNSGVATLTFVPEPTTVITNSGTITGTIDGIASRNHALTVNNSGLIAGGPGGAGIVSTSSFVVTINNSGTISGTYFNGEAIVTDDAIIKNSGKITGAIGINAANLTLNNSGTIVTGATAVQSRVSGLITLTNSGLISGGSSGVAAAGGGTITNSGSIVGGTSDGINHGGTINVTNTGMISAGRFGIGAKTAANIVNLNNSGTITGGIVGVRANGHGDITNSGTIIGGSGVSVQFGAIGGPASDTLTVLSGARFGGLVDFGGGADTVNFARGNWIINTANFDAALSTVNTGGNPYVATSNQIVVADISGFGAQNRAIMDITGWISSVLPDTPTSSSATLGVATTSYAEADRNSPFAAFDSFPADAMGYAKAPLLKAANVAYADGSAAWTKGFGGQRQQDTTASFIGATTTGYGGAFGYERMVQPDMKIGVLIGGSTNKTNLDQNAGSTGTDTVFGGAYGRKTWGATFLDLAVIGGSLDNSSTRNIFGGLAAQVANANYGGWFINPSLSFGRTFDVNPLGITVTPALKVRYVDAHFDGYMESGSTANLTVNGRDFAAWEERAELTFADTAKWGASRITGRVTIGGLAQQRTGGGLVDIAFLGQSFLASTPDRASITGGFGSAGIDWQIGNLTVFATGEAMASDDSSRVYSGRGGVRLNW